MASSTDLTNAIEVLKRRGNEMLARFARTHRGVIYADLRFEVMFNRSGAATNGEPRDYSESESAAFGVSVHASAEGGAVGHGQCGAEIGRVALNQPKLAAEISAGLEQAFARARTSARAKAAIMRRLKGSAASLTGGAFEPRAPVRDEVAAVFKRDPRTLAPAELKAITLEASRAVRGLGREVAFNAIAAMTEIRHELFASTEGSLIAQACAFSQGDCYVVAQSGSGHQESYDTIGQQRGFEALAEGSREELLSESGARGLLRRARERGARACRGAGAQAARRRSRGGHRPALQRAHRARNRRPSERGRSRAQDGGGVRGAELVSALRSTTTKSACR